MEPATTGALISAAGALIGGNQMAKGSKGIPWWRQENMFWATVDQAVERRVNDAKRAGVHPLFALGMNPPQSSPIAVGGGGSDRGFTEAGQSLGRAIAARKTQAERELERLALEEMGSRATRNFAEASYYNSLAARARQENVASRPFPDVVVGAYKDGAKGLQSHPLFSDAVRPEADPMVSRSTAFAGETAGRDHPGMRQFELPGGYRILLPATQGGGVPEEFDASMIPLIIGANLERYGWRWIVDSVGYVTGNSPNDRRGRTVESLLRRIFERR